MNFFCSFWCQVIDGELSIYCMTSCSGFDLTLRAISFFSDFISFSHSNVFELKDAATEDAIALGNDVVAMAKRFGIFVVIFFQVFHILIRHN